MNQNKDLIIFGRIKTCRLRWIYDKQNEGELVKEGEFRFGSYISGESIYAVIWDIQDKFSIIRIDEQTLQNQILIEFSWLLSLF